MVDFMKYDEFVLLQLERTAYKLNKCYAMERRVTNGQIFVESLGTKRDTQTFSLII